MLGKIAAWFARKALAKEREPDLDKRAELRAALVPDVWMAILERELPAYRKLSSAQREKLHADVSVFIGEKQFVGEDGFVVDDRVKVIVAASASLLVLGRDIALFDHVRRIVIREQVAKNVGGQYKQMVSKLDDEIVDTWAIVELGWTEVQRGFVRAEGQNTVFHEFAHALDDADGKMDALLNHQHFERWKTLLHEMPLHRRVEGLTIFTEIIGDVEGPELFASATELFFECPKKLHDLDAALFDALVEIYGIDPRRFS